MIVETLTSTNPPKGQEKVSPPLKRGTLLKVLLLYQVGVNVILRCEHPEGNSLLDLPLNGKLLIKDLDQEPDFGSDSVKLLFKRFYKGQII